MAIWTNKRTQLADEFIFSKIENQLELDQLFLVMFDDELTVWLVLNLHTVFRR